MQKLTDKNKTFFKIDLKKIQIQSPLFIKNTKRNFFARKHAKK